MCRKTYTVLVIALVKIKRRIAVNMKVGKGIIIIGPIFDLIIGRRCPAEFRHIVVLNVVILRREIVVFRTMIFSNPGTPFVEPADFLIESCGRT